MAATWHNSCHRLMIMVPCDTHTCGGLATIGVLLWVATKNLGKCLWMSAYHTLYITYFENAPVMLELAKFPLCKNQAEISMYIYIYISRLHSKTYFASAEAGNVPFQRRAFMVLKSSHQNSGLFKFLSTWKVPITSTLKSKRKFQSTKCIAQRNQRNTIYGTWKLKRFTNKFNWKHRNSDNATRFIKPQMYNTKSQTKTLPEFGQHYIIASRGGPYSHHSLALRLDLTHKQTIQITCQNPLS